MSLIKAVNLHKSGYLKEAINLYSSLLNESPLNPEVLHLYGLAAHQCGDSDLAVELIKKAIELKPNTALFARNLGQVHLHARRQLS